MSVETIQNDKKEKESNNEPFSRFARPEDGRARTTGSVKKDLNGKQLLSTLTFSLGGSTRSGRIGGGSNRGLRSKAPKAATSLAIRNIMKKIWNKT